MCDLGVCDSPAVVTTPAGNRLCQWCVDGGAPVLSCCGDCGTKEHEDSADEVGHREDNGDWWCAECWAVTKAERDAEDAAADAEAAVAAYHAAREALGAVAQRECQVLHPGGRTCAGNAQWRADLIGSPIDPKRFCAACQARAILAGGAL